MKKGVLSNLRLLEGLVREDKSATCREVRTDGANPRGSGAGGGWRARVSPLLGNTHDDSVGDSHRN